MEEPTASEISCAVEEALAVTTIDKIENAAQEEVHDPYFYTNQQDLFTSEIFKIELHNLPKFFGLGELRKMITNTLGLDANKVKPATLTSVFVCFRSQQSKEEGVKILNGYKWKNRELRTTDARPAKDPLMLKRKKMSEGGGASKMPKFDTPEEMLQDCIKRLKDKTTPYWEQPYDQQLKLKMEKIEKIMQTLDKEIGKMSKELSTWCAHKKALHNGFICQIEPFKRAEITEGYRNRCEFTIGLNAATKEPTAGFRMDSYSSGDCCVFPVDECVHISDVAKRTTSLFQQFLRESPHRPFDPVSRSGHFRTLCVRTSSKGQLMVTLDFHTTGLSAEQLDTLKSSYRHFFEHGPAKPLNVTSLNFRGLDVQTKKNEGNKAAELIYGEPFIVEEMLGLQFEMSPTSFFQVNTPAAEVLYSTIGELAAPTEQSTVLDICCGTGTIGISMAKRAGQVLGIECVPEAIENAKRNAASNGLQHKCDFFTGNAQSALQPTLVRAKHDDIVAILDPPRPGVQPNVLNVIRGTNKINRLVFVACNLEASYKNLLHLAKPASKQTPGLPFLPVKVIPVDLFPHTLHYEVIIYLERRAPLSDIPPTVLDSQQVGVEPEAGGQGQAAAKQANGHMPPTKATASQPPAEGAKKVDQIQKFQQLFGGSTMLSKQSRRRRNRLLEMILMEAYAKAVGIADHTQVDPRELVKLFARKVSLEEFATFVSQPLPKPRKQPAPFKQPNMHMFDRHHHMQQHFQPAPFEHNHYVSIMDGATQTDCREFMSREELATAHELGVNWGGQVPDRLLHDIRALKQEEEEAVQRFREGFLLALKSKQRMLIESYERDAPHHRPARLPRRDNAFPHHHHQQQQQQQHFALNFVPRHRESEDFGAMRSDSPDVGFPLLEEGYGEGWGGQQQSSRPTPRQQQRSTRFTSNPFPQPDSSRMFWS